MDIFHTLAEVAVAITGFASLIIVFRRVGVSEWGRQELVSLGFLLCWSIGGIFLSLLPIIAVAFGAAAELACRIGLAALTVMVVTVGGYLTWIQRRAISSDAYEFGRRSRLVTNGIGAMIPLLAPLAAMGLVPGPVDAWLALLITVLLLLATTNLGLFVTTLVDSRRDP